MSDYHKVHDTNYKKFYKDKRETNHGIRQPTILTKPDRVFKDKSEFNKKPLEKPQPQPTIILRPREGDNTRAVSPNQRPTFLRKEEPVHISYQLASKNNPLENVNPLAPIPEMKNAIKLLDDINSQLCENILEFLLDQNDFLVVGCFGTQGVGKSTLMSVLAGNTFEDVVSDKGIFKIANSEHIDYSLHCTSGMDIYVTRNRTILIDTQPILSASILDKMSTHDNKKLANEMIPFENQMEILSLHLVSFLLSVCHVVILAQDWFFDANILRFIQTAEMLKPSTHTTSQDEEIIEYFPQIVFYHNRAQPSEFHPNYIKKMEDIYLKTFSKSRLEIFSHIGSNITSDSSINLFLFPDLAKELEANDFFKGHIGSRELMDRIRTSIYGARRQHLTQTPLSERNWFHYASKVWEGIKKSTFFSEYNKLMP